VKGRSRVPNPVIVAEEEKDVRVYSLTEEQKAIKAKYPPVNQKYEYLDHEQISSYKHGEILWRKHLSSVQPPHLVK
jgi:hypothetical protein